jgi:hypothetical protein
MSLRNDAKGQQTEGQTNQAPETLISTDLSADYQAGIAFANARARAFGDGVRDQMALIQQGMKGFSGGKFVVAQATYDRPALAPSDEQAAQSLTALLYGTDYEVVDHG